MQSSPSSTPAASEAPSVITGDEEAERIRRLVARMTEAKRMLDGLLANLALVEMSMTDSTPDGPTH
ncbi:MULTISPECIES: hypothetical protein [unclassified Shinella]|uniref:hypothetical protein n=1 Tax=Shinella TaxID=323620 RepID=UPI00225D3B7C|nr:MULTISPECIES: hypothetical protein [unclassified Shinella]MCO5139701.1 hypothetical protein [Shinella sp.]MDC7258662.1 hypothetical protein [Shinella sp. YE25]CAI0335010.1 conserved hypothetical protein [Rhizobiaceae bacterium]CAK7260426.1 conserved protein of unknown function [Shinella sp. WSC3-e]